jgi:hypothetical protein
MLDDCPELQYLLKKYPRLHQQLKDIYASTQPPASEPTARIPGLSMMRSNNWNRDVGIRKGLEALRKARKAPGEDGEALREYTELIVHLVYGQETHNAVSDTISKTRSEEERRFIQALMEAKH